MAIAGFSGVNKYGNPDTAYVAGKGYAPISSFSGGDMLVDFIFPGATPIRIGTASTITYSQFREIRQHRTLGRVSAKGLVRGPRTIGGSLIFTVIEAHVGTKILEALKSASQNYTQYVTIKPDELPPFDIIMTFANEYGQSAKMVIYGATIVEDAMTFSVDDIFTENTMMYIARDINLMTGPWDPKMAIYTVPGQVLRSNNESVGKFTIQKVDSGAALQAYWANLKNK
jgi:hypothetical protein